MTEEQHKTMNKIERAQNNLEKSTKTRQQLQDAQASLLRVSEIDIEEIAALRKLLGEITLILNAARKNEKAYTDLLTEAKASLEEE